MVSDAIHRPAHFNVVGEASCWATAFANTGQSLALGRDIAGEISVASPRASDFKPGQKVMAIPGPNEVLVKLAATSVNPIDWTIQRGNWKATVALHFPVIRRHFLIAQLIRASISVHLDGFHRSDLLRIEHLPADCVGQFESY